MSGLTCTPTPYEGQDKPTSAQDPKFATKTSPYTRKSRYGAKRAKYTPKTRPYSALNPFTAKASKFTAQTKPYSAKSPLFTPLGAIFGQGQYCAVLLQENGSPVLQEDRNNINL